MNYSRILLSEVEKKRILGLHNTTKKNPTTRLINEAQDKPQLFPVCVRWAGNHVNIADDPSLNDAIGLAGPIDSLYAVHVPNGGGSGVDYYWSQETQVGRLLIIKKAWEATTGDDTSPEIRSYNCVCVNGKCSPKSYADQEYKKEHECSDKTPCTKGGDQGGGKDTNCRNKTPYNAITDAGMNFKDVQAKWIAANCNGTTPCIKGNATTNINLRNAFCDGTWKPDGSKDDGTLPITNQACKEKCSQQPKEFPPGSIVPQVMGYFFDSKKGECVAVTGQIGPFQSLEECKKCNCNNKNEQGIVIKLPTLAVLLECFKTHLVTVGVIQLPTSCQTDRGTLPTDPTKCFQDLLNGKTIVIIIEFLLCLFPGSKIPSPIDQIPIKIPDEKNPGQEIEVPIIKIPGVDIPIFQPPVITPIKPKD